MGPKPRPLLGTTRLGCKCLPPEKERQVQQGRQDLGRDNHSRDFVSRREEVQETTVASCAALRKDLEK